MPLLNFVGANPNAVAWENRVGLLWETVSQNGISSDSMGQFVERYTGPVDASGRPVVGSTGNYIKTYYHIENDPAKVPHLVVGPGKDAENPFLSEPSTSIAPGTPFKTAEAILPEVVAQVVSPAPWVAPPPPIPRGEYTDADGNTWSADDGEGGRHIIRGPALDAALQFQHDHPLVTDQSGNAVQPGAPVPGFTLPGGGAVTPEIFNPAPSIDSPAAPTAAAPLPDHFTTGGTGGAGWGTGGSSTTPQHGGSASAAPAMGKVGGKALGIAAVVIALLMAFGKKGGA